LLWTLEVLSKDLAGRKNLGCQIDIINNLVLELSFELLGLTSFISKAQFVITKEVSLSSKVSVFRL